MGELAGGTKAYFLEEICSLMMKEWLISWNPYLLFVFYLGIEWMGVDVGGYTSHTKHHTKVDDNEGFE